MRHVVATTALAIALAITPAAVASAGLPQSATLSDRRGDGESRAFDIHRIRGSVVGNKLVLVMKVDNITRRNVAPIYGPTSSALRTIFGLNLRVNGHQQARYLVTRSGWRGNKAVLRNKRTTKTVDCTPADGSFDTAGPGSLRLSARKDTARFTVPLSCIPRVRTVSFTGYTMDSRTGSYRADYTQRRGTTVDRWSRWFSVR